ncbi:MAG: LamG domain-containing protein [Gammaproteobacteria bacterium]|nr:LamG domain-containing protein [Gammaproteobacteria bacterium]
MRLANNKQSLKTGRPILLWLGFSLISAVLMSGCGGGASTSSNSNNQQQQIVTYTGPAAADADTRQFQTAMWENIRSATRCGGCHDPASSTPQAPYFARNDDVNMAYAALMDSSASSLLTVGSGSTPSGVAYIDRVQTEQSYLVIKAVTHNCWLGASEGSVCSDTINAYVDNWVGAAGGGSTKTIQLTAPATLADPGASKNYPADDAIGVVNFSTLPTAGTSLFTLLSTNCSGCHVSSSRTPQAPFFADSDANVAYSELKAAKKIDLDTPANSRIIVRLREESHNCWTPNNCAGDAQQLEDAVTAFAGNLIAIPVAADLIFSKALKLSDAIVASGGNRYENNAIALYEFKRGTGTIAYDTSGVTPELNLSLSGNPGDVTWVRGYGVQFKGAGKAQGSVVNSRKLYNSIKDVGEYSIEAWVVPSNVTQEGPAHILSYMGTGENRNFTLGQTLYEYDMLNRSNTTGGNGQPMSSTSNETLQATLQHVVVTVDPVNGKQIYVNGNRVVQDTAGAGTLANWDSDFAFVLGNDQGRSKSWAGKLRLVAIHNRALTQTQITQNFDVGVGAKFLMLFSVKDYTCPGNTDITQCGDYVMFEVSEFDNYGYLFSKPMFVRITNDALAADIRISGMRVGINGQESIVGQSYRNIDITVSSSDDIKAGVPLSTLGTVIPSQKGSDGDEFFLTFERLVTLSTYDYTEAGASGVLVDANENGLVDRPAVSDMGMRTFDEINASMASMTTVDPYAGTAPNRIIDQYNVIMQQLPAVEAMNGFLSAHQMGVAQIAIAYCDALVEDPAKRTVYFNDGTGSFDFTANVDTAFNTAAGDSVEKNRIVNKLFENMIGIQGSGTALNSAPALAQFKAETIGPATTNTNNLFDRLYNGCATNLRSNGSPRSPACVQDASRTRATVKAMCASALGSAAMLVQ